MSYCSNCGAKLPDGAAFCGNCGTPVANGHIPPPYPDDGIKKHKPHIKTDEHKTTTSVEKETRVSLISSLFRLFETTLSTILSVNS